MEHLLTVAVIAGIVAMVTTNGPQMLLSDPLVSGSVLGILFGFLGFHKDSGISSI